MYYPSIETVKELSAQGNLIPLYQEINADLETPVSAYIKVARPPYSFLLESVEGGERLARFSFIGTEPSQVITTGLGSEAGQVDPLELIENVLTKFTPVSVDGLPRFHGGVVGYLGYDCVRYFEPRVPKPAVTPLDLPESLFMLADTILVFDHLRHKILVVTHIHIDGPIEQAYKRAVARIDGLVRRLQRPLPRSERIQQPKLPPSDQTISSNITFERYQDVVKQAKEFIEAGDVIQVVISQRLSRPTTAGPLAIYRALRTINPSPYMYYLDLGNFHLIGASPELLVRTEEGVVENHPIAGTRRRGNSPEEDALLETELKEDIKERAEHVMLLDLGRNDIGRVSQIGTVEVTQMMDVEKYSHVMHLVSHVKGKLDPGSDAFAALRASFPAGTVSGAPKIRAMEIIAELEGEARGPYAGAVGYFSFAGNMDTAITIRTIVLTEGIAYVQAGGGIVYDSAPENEYMETMHKAQALMGAITYAEQQD